MAVVVYQCDTCKRETYRAQNRMGLDVIGRCIITNGCRGKLNLQEVKPSYAIGHSTPPVIGLADWTPRKVLYTHNQGFLKKVWEVRHDLNNQPSVSVYVNKVVGTTETLVRTEPLSIDYTSNDTLQLTFATAVTGVAQCQARSASDGQNITTLIPVDVDATDPTTFNIAKSFRLTSGSEVGELTLATRVSTVAVSGFAPTQQVLLNINFLSPSDLSELNVPVQLTLRDVNNTPVDTSGSPWAGAKYAVINGHKYLLRSVNIHSEGQLTTLGVPPGAPFYFTVNYLGNEREIAEGEMLVLTAAAPYHVVDRDYSTVADVSQITKSTASALTTYSDANLLGNTALLEEIYPSIMLL